MSSDPAGSGSSAYVRPSANDRFKRRWSRSVVGATLLGVVFHFVILFGTPQMRVETTAEKRAAPAQLFSEPSEARTRQFLQRVIDAGRM